MKAIALARFVVAVLLVHVLLFSGAYANDTNYSGENKSQYSKGAHKTKVIPALYNKKADFSRKYLKHSKRKPKQGNVPTTENETIIFDKNYYQRHKGYKRNPKFITNSFSTADPSAEYTLKIFNGSISGNGDKAGKYSRVTSAVVILNGTKIYDPRDFNKKVGYLETAVTLSTENRLKVKLWGKPGSGFRLMFVKNDDGGGEVNLPPSITSNPITTATEDVAYQYDVNATDPNDNDTLTYQLAEAPTGMIIDTSSGLVQWTPTNGDVGIHTVTVKVTDTDDLSDSQSFTLAVSNINDAPVAANDSYTTNEDEALLVNATQGLLTNDSDQDNDSLTATIVTTPSQGVVVLNLDGSFSYTPNANFYGEDSFTYVASDGTAQSEIATVTITVHPVLDPLPIVQFSTDPLQITAGDSSTLSWSVDSATAVSISPGVGAVTLSGVLSVLPIQTTTYTLSATGIDGVTTEQVTITVIAPPPAITFTATPEQITTGETATLNWDVIDATEVSITPDIGIVATTGSVDVTPQQTTSYTLTANGEGGNSSQQVTIQVQSGMPLPPDPVEVAPPLKTTEITPFHEANNFLYTGANPVQYDIDPTIIEPERVAVIKGSVYDRANNPLPGVKIFIHNHPEFGWTLSRADGEFDMAVNGGGLLTINYAADGYLPVQRKVQAPWKDYDFANDVVMIPLDSQVTTVDLVNSTGIQVVQGTTQIDVDGVRQATILFPQGVSATMTLPDGSTQSLPTIHVRATEYTVGDNGLETMPGPLPPTSAYTYAVELSVDEAIAANASRVDFDKSIPLYVDNFIGFPVGEAVPSGYYDYEKADWIASENGRVIAILDIVDGLAILDIDGSNTPADATQLAALGITGAERIKLASLYPVGKSLWRTPISHFTPHDLNWPIFFPANAVSPSNLNVKTVNQDSLNDSNYENSCSGCVISPQGQTLGESIPVNGTPFSLHYQSDRMAGYKADNTIDIPLTGDTIPDSLVTVGYLIRIAGRQFGRPHRYKNLGGALKAAPNLTENFVWDGLDLYGRKVLGSAKAEITITYIYPCHYASGEAGFAASNVSGRWIDGSRLTCRFMGWPQRYDVMIRSPFQASTSDAGKWSLNVHHSWDPVEHRFYGGDGSFRKIAESIIETVAGNLRGTFAGDEGPATEANLAGPGFITFDASGNLYISDSGNNRIRRVTPEGVITTVAGNGQYGYSGDGGPAIEASINRPNGIAVDPEGNLYIADYNNHRIRKVTPDGNISTIAGTGVRGYSGDGGPATEAKLYYPLDLSLDAYGNLYFADAASGRVRRIAPDGTINTVAGTLSGGIFDDGVLATEATLYNISGIALDKEGNLYIAEANRIRRVTTDGIITTVAGNGVMGFSGDGWFATEAALNQPADMAVDKWGNLLITDSANSRIRRVTPEGIISTVVGDGQYGWIGDGGLPTKAQISYPRGIIFDPDGNLYFADQRINRIRRVVYEGVNIFHPDGYSIVSSDGSQQFIFNVGGRHLRTIDTLTGVILYKFGYDNDGLLISMIDRDGNMTILERDGAGEVMAIIAPDGQRTDIFVDMNGYLTSVTNPAGESYQMEYTPDGLMTLFQDRKGNSNIFEYDDLGLLLKDTNADGGGWTLGRTDLASGYLTSMISGEGRVSTFSVEPQTNDDTLQVNTRTDGSVQQILRKSNGETVTTQANGTLITTIEAPDPLFGLQLPMIVESRIKLPSGLESITTSDKLVEQSDPVDLLKVTMQSTTTTVNSKAVTRIYNATASTITTTTAEGRMSTQTLDDKGRITSSSTLGLETTYLSYDVRGRLQATIQGSGVDERINTITYDGYGNIASVTNPLGETTSFNYDAVGRVLNQVKPDSSNIGFDYDANGNTTLITPPEKPGHTFAFNGVDLATDYTAPDIGLINHSTTNNYDLDKKLLQVDRPDNQSVVFNHDPVTGQLTSMEGSRGTTTYEYDQTSGQLNTITAPGGEMLGYQYDGALPVSKTWSGTISGEVAFGYNNDFRLSSMTVVGDVINYGYDNDGLLTQAGELALSYSAQNGLLEGTALSNTDTSQSYSSFGELSGYDAAYNATSLFNTNYERDKLGRIVTKSETIGDITHTYGYSYDVVGRLVEVTQDGMVSDTFSYDANGNRLTHNGTSATYDEQDRLVTYSGAIYSYTANGELTSKNVGGVTTRYTYDTLGNLTQATLPDGTGIDYVIDGQNRRIGKKVNGQLIQGFLYQDQLNPIADLDGLGNVVSRFIYAEKGNVPSYMVKDGTTYRIVSDHLGSVRLVVDATTGDILQAMDYDAFGRVILDSNPGFQPFGFAGGIYDLHTGLVRFGARDYDAEIGRWTAKDPIGFDGGDSNVYGYVGGNPISRTDPNGLYWFRQSWQTPGAVGRPDTIVPPGGPVSEFIEKYVPAGYTFGEVHDSFVDIATRVGIPDGMANKPSMSLMYWEAVKIEILRTLGYLKQPTPQPTQCK